MSAPDEANFGDDTVLVRLLQQAGQGDKAALEQLFRRLYPYLLLCAREELDSDLRAQVRESDLVQQSCLEAHRDFPRFDGHDVGTLVKWLEKILRANAADLRRRFNARQRNGVGPDISLDDSQSSLAQELRQNLLDSGAAADMTGSNATDLELEKALAKLSDDYREVILLRHRDKLSFAEIGTKTGRSADAVRMCWTRAVKRLQNNLDGEAQPEE